MLAAMKYTGADPNVELEYRKRSRWKALVPRLETMYRHVRWNDFQLVHDALYPTFPFRIADAWSPSYGEFRVMATWDLSDLVFNLDTTFFGRVARVNFELRDWVPREAHRFYGELRRLRVLMANEPPKDLRVRLIYKLRIEELTNYMNFLTGNYLKRWQKGDHPAGADTRWWRPWVTESSR
jgi:hypothetical protein